MKKLIFGLILCMVLATGAVSATTYWTPTLYEGEHTLCANECTETYGNYVDMDERLPMDKKLTIKRANKLYLGRFYYYELDTWVKIGQVYEHPKGVGVIVGKKNPNFVIFDHTVQPIQEKNVKYWVTGIIQ